MHALICYHKKEANTYATKLLRSNALVTLWSIEIFANITATFDHNMLAWPEKKVKTRIVEANGQSITIIRRFRCIRRTFRCISTEHDLYKESTGLMYTTHTKRRFHEISRYCFFRALPIFLVSQNYLDAKKHITK